FRNVRVLDRDRRFGLQASKGDRDFCLALFLGMNVARLVNRQVRGFGLQHCLVREVESLSRGRFTENQDAPFVAAVLQSQGGRFHLERAQGRQGGLGRRGGFVRGGSARRQAGCQRQGEAK